MNIKINGRDIRFFNEFNVTLKYDSIASSFSFNVQFNPENIEHRNLFKPFKYNSVEVWHENELLLTGLVLINGFNSEAREMLIPIAGYSKTGVLEDCEIPVSSYPLQSISLSLQQIAQKLIKPFGLNMKVDSSVQNRMNTVFKSSTADEKQTIKSYLCSKASQKNIVLTHTEKGELLFTEANTKQIPIFDFTRNIPGVHMQLSCNGQNMHSDITVLKQADDEGGNAGQITIKNPYVPIFRSHVKTQSSGDDVSIKETARAVLAEELKSIALTIKLDRWDLNGKLIRPNNMINVMNPNLYLYKKTSFFIEQVELIGDEKQNTAILTCYLPEVYDSKTPKNIFA